MEKNCRFNFGTNLKDSSFGAGMFQFIGNLQSETNGISRRTTLWLKVGRSSQSLEMRTETHSDSRKRSLPHPPDIFLCVPENKFNFIYTTISFIRKYLGVT
jgi:hypothetical protein